MTYPYSATFLRYLGQTPVSSKALDFQGKVIKISEKLIRFVLWMQVCRWVQARREPSSDAQMMLTRGVARVKVGNPISNEK